MHHSKTVSRKISSSRNVSVDFTKIHSFLNVYVEFIDFTKFFSKNEFHEIFQTYLQIILGAALQTIGAFSVSRSQSLGCWVSSSMSKSVHKYWPGFKVVLHFTETQSRHSWNYWKKIRLQTWFDENIWKKMSVKVSHCGNYGNLLSHFFDKNSVNSIFLQNR